VAFNTILNYCLKTYFGKNNTYKLNTEKRYEYEANNLLKTTIRNLSFFAMYLDTNSQEKYLKSSEILIERIFYLYLYDIGEIYDFTKLYN
jgi:hypothetical protein